MPETKPFVPVVCPVGNFCAATFEDAPPCNSAEQLPQLLLAEELCPRAVAAAITAEKAQPLPPGKNVGRAKSRRNCTLGGLYIDLALAGNEDGVREENLAKATGYLQEAASRPTQAAGINAAFLQLYVPMFRMRNFRPISDNQTAYLQKGLLDIVDKAPRDNKTVQGKAGIHFLYARDRKTAFPVTAREAGHFVRQAKSGHLEVRYDLYTIDTQGAQPTKAPHLATKPDGRIDVRQSINAGFGSLAQRAFRLHLPGEADEIVEAREQAFNWLYDEAAGYRLEPTQTRVLDEMGRILDGRRGDYLASR